ncbi:MAG: hypothetical protein JW384_00294 [Nitrosomonadaceae bacterium]|nr:hypothetical protein [Nitrosomonadaceae bacterium]
MHVKSLGYRTDLVFSEFEGEVTDRGDYLVITTPTNPGYFWGNFLLFAGPPTQGDLQSWSTLFAAEFACWPQVDHLAFGWDSPDGAEGAVNPFLDAGFRVLRRTVLAASAVVCPPSYNPNIEVRSLEGDSDWDQVLETQLESSISEGGHSPGHIQMTRTRVDGFRAMVEAGLGKWFGAFVGKQMAGGLGLFVKQGVGRFQEVVTRFEYRRQGICRSLVYRASIQAFAHMGAEKLVMVADDDYVAARIYEQVGFRPVEHQVGVDNWRL